MDIKEMWQALFHPPTDGPRATLVLRVMAGSVFLWEGIMKYVFPNLGVGRFTKLGFPMPGLTTGFVAWVEIIGGILMILGWITRPVAIAFVIEMLMAMLSTKIPMFLGRYPLALPPAPPQTGFWAVLHEIRSEYAQCAVSLYLLLAGPGPISLDARVKEPERSRSRVVSAALAALLCLLMIGAAQANMGFSSPMPTASEPDYYQQGKQAVEHKDFGTAGSLLRKALAAHPKDPDVLNLLAFSERKQGHLDEAFEYYEQALRVKPHFPEAREYLGEAHLQAALREVETLKSYGTEGKEDLEDLVKDFKTSAASL